MIGQKKLLQKVNNLKSLPHSMLLIGEKGSEQNEVCDYIADKFNLVNMNITELITKDFIDQIYESHTPTLYVVDLIQKNVDLNVLLKLFEEPTEYTYIIIIAESDGMVLDTIITRSIIFKSDTYTREELEPLILNDKELVLQICNTPGQVNILNHTDVKLLHETCENLIKSLKNISTHGILSFANLINYSDEYDKFDLYMFVKTLKYVLKSMITTPDPDIGSVYYLLSLYKRVLEYTEKSEVISQYKQRYFENLLLDLKNVSLLLDE